MDISALWTGDDVQIISSQKVGKFEGIAKDGRARVSYHGKILLVRETNLQEYTAPVSEELIDFENDEQVHMDLKVSAKFVPEIDLHIDILNPSLVNAIPEHILNHQLSACTRFIEDAIKYKAHAVTIIHGKGRGRLKAEVVHLLNGYDKVTMIASIHNGGAQRVQINVF